MLYESTADTFILIVLPLTGYIIGTIGKTLKNNQKWVKKDWVSW